MSTYRILLTIYGMLSTIDPMEAVCYPTGVDQEGLEDMEGPFVAG